MTDFPGLAPVERWSRHSLPWGRACLPAHPGALTTGTEYMHELAVRQDLLIHANMIYLYRCKFDKFQRNSKDSNINWKHLFSSTLCRVSDTQIQHFLNLAFFSFDVFFSFPVWISCCHFFCMYSSTNPHFNQKYHLQMVCVQRQHDFRAQMALWCMYYVNKSWLVIILFFQQWPIIYQRPKFQSEI